MIYGIGIDLIEVLRIEKILNKRYEPFTRKVYSSAEIDYCKKKPFPQIHFAARFAAKESFLKALGIGLGMGVSLTDIELINQMNEKPILKLHNKAKSIIIDEEIRSVQVSVSHTKNYAGAVVILEK